MAPIGREGTQLLKEGTFDWCEYAFLSRVQQMSRLCAFGGKLIKCAHETFQDLSLDRRLQYIGLCLRHVEVVKCVMIYFKAPHVES